MSLCFPSLLINMDKKQVINKIGKENWDDFQEFMTGQTVGFDKGVIDYYECDVDRFRPVKVGDDGDKKGTDNTRRAHNR